VECRSADATRSSSPARHPLERRDHSLDEARHEPALGSTNAMTSGPIPRLRPPGRRELDAAVDAEEIRVLPATRSTKSSPSSSTLSCGCDAAAEHLDAGLTPGQTRATASLERGHA
jgi:hypothetical protein